MDLLTIIAANTFRVSDLKRRARVIKEYLESKLFGGASKPQFNPEDQAWLATLPETLNTLDSKSFYKLMEELNKKIVKLTPLTVYLAFEMPEPELAKLALNVRTTLNSPTTFLDIKIDHNLVGGASFSYKGVYRDYSLRKSLENQRDKILTEMRRYIS